MDSSPLEGRFRLLERKIEDLQAEIEDLHEPPSIVIDPTGDYREAIDAQTVVEEKGKTTAIQVPHYATTGSAGFDVRSPERVMLTPGSESIINLQFKVDIPLGYCMEFIPRSSTGFKYLRLANTVGLIDSDYTDEIMLKVRNEGDSTITIEQWHRFAQATVKRVVQADLYRGEVGFKMTNRTGGIGSTGSA